LPKQLDFAAAGDVCAEQTEYGTTANASADKQAKVHERADPLFRKHAPTRIRPSEKCDAAAQAPRNPEYRTYNKCRAARGRLVAVVRCLRLLLAPTE
jgi:hypothetical protein